MLPTERPRRVLMTADAVGGVWTYAVELCRALNARGTEVALAVMGPGPSPDQRAEIASLRGVTLHARPYRLEWMPDPWDDVADAGEWLVALERDWQPDIVHLNGYCHGSLPWLAPSVVVAHSCVLSWWQAVHGEEAPASWNHYRREVRCGLQAAGAVVAPSRTMLTWTEERYGPLRRTRTILNGRSAADSEIAKERLILAVGRLWDGAKNIGAVCEVAADLAWPVAVAGACVDAPGALPLTNARHLGQLASSDVQQWMARASIYVLPARYEPFGLSVLEAALAGCALVLGDIPSLREVWGDAALYVHPDDRAGLRETLNALTFDDERRSSLAVTARRRAAALTPELMADGYCAVYAELISERRSLLSLSAV